MYELEKISLGLVTAFLWLCYLIEFLSMMFLIFFLYLKYFHEFYNNLRTFVIGPYNADFH